MHRLPQRKGRKYYLTKTFCPSIQDFLRLDYNTKSK
jgi:hypothetical protein